MEIRPSAQQYLPPVVKNLLIINGLFFLATIVYHKVTGGELASYLALHYIESPDFKIWQVITHMFMHSRELFIHILFNMFGLWMFGTVIEQRLGSKRFLQFYIWSGIGAAFFYMAIWAIEYHYLGNQRVLMSVMLGASGAVYGLLFAFGYLFPDAVIHLYFVIPIKAKYFVGLLAIIGLYMGIGNSGDGIAHFAHLGGMLAAFIIFKVWKIRYNAG